MLRTLGKGVLGCLFVLWLTSPVWAGEADLAIPDLHAGKFNLFGSEISGWNLLLGGAMVIGGTLGISLYLRAQIAILPAHQSMLAVAEKRYAATPGDQGATYDYAMAIGRTAGLRTSEPATRLALYEKSTGLLTEALVRDPANGEARSNLASHKESMGDLSISIGRQADGWKAYRESLRIIEERPVKVAIGRRVAISVSSKLAEHAARQGDAVQAVSMAKHALSLAEKIGPADPVPAQVLRGRAYESMGSVQALLRHPVEARQWRAKALTDYRSLASKPDFTKAFRARMAALEKAIAEEK